MSAMALMRKILLRKRVRAHLEYLRIVLLEFKVTLVLAAVVLLQGSMLFHFLHVDPATGLRPDYVDALYRTFVLMSMNFPDSLPQHPLLRVWCFAVPFLSFILVSEAVVRLAVLLSSRAGSGRRWIKAMVATFDKHVILCGMAQLGFSILGELLKMGKEVVVVEIKEEAFGVSQARRMSAPVVIGDARDEHILIDVGIHKAQAVIAATNNDMANLEIALDARSLRPGVRVVVRMYDQQVGEKVARSFDIKLIFSTSAIAAPSFAAATVDRALVNSFYIDDKQLQTVKLLVGQGSRLIGKPLRFLREQRQLSILSHRRHNQEAVLFPSEEVVLQEKDKVAILAQSAVIGELHQLNEGRQ
jgi:Trk K+ transport system NAD-binding subunit